MKSSKGTQKTAKTSLQAQEGQDEVAEEDVAGVITPAPARFLVSRLGLSRPYADVDVAKAEAHRE